VAIERTSKFAYVELHEKAGKMQAAQFLRQLAKALPYAIHIVLTDNGIQFTHGKQDKHVFEHIFDRACRELSIEHRLTQVKHPWSNGQLERINRTIKEATIKLWHYPGPTRYTVQITVPRRPCGTREGQGKGGFRPLLPMMR
jgi:transposase InsO family protein